jgi:hypothetical protein
MRSAWPGSACGVALFLSLTSACDRPHLVTNTVDSGQGAGGTGGRFVLPGSAGSSGSGGAPAPGDPYPSADARLDRTPGSGGAAGIPGSTDGPVASPPLGAAPADGPAVSPPDAGPATPPDTNTGTVVMVTACETINCPQLMQLTAGCSGNDSECTANEVSSTLSNYCHDNGVTKQSTRIYSGEDEVDYTTTMQVRKSDGSACYTVVMTGSEESDLERWVFRSPAGHEVGRAEWDKDEDVLTLICGGTRWVLGDIACPGTDGEPEPDQCSEGDCDIP